MLLSQRPAVVTHEIQQDRHRLERTESDHPHRKHPQCELVHDRCLRVDGSGVHLARDGCPRCEMCSDGGKYHQRYSYQNDGDTADVAECFQLCCRARNHGGQRCAERSEEHTSELKSLMRISYAVFCLQKKIKR